MFYMMSHNVRYVKLQMLDAEWGVVCILFVIKWLTLL